MIIKPLKADHFEAMTLQPKQAWIGEFVSAEHMAFLINDHAWGGWVDDEIVACAGIVELWRGRAHGWALLSTDAGPHMLTIHRAVYRGLKVAQYRRIETTVECDHVAGHRWAKSLGFECEAERMVGYGENGADHAMYRWTG